MTLAALTMVAVLQATPARPALLTQDPPVAPVEKLVPPTPVRLPGLKRVTRGDALYWTNNQGDLVATVAEAGRWLDLPATPVAGPSRVRIVVAREIGLLGPDAEGRLVSRRTSFSENDIQKINVATRLAASYLAASGSPVTIDLVEDRNPRFYDQIPFSPEFSPEENGVNQSLYDELVLPKTNVAKFESDDPTDFGPFDLTIVVHAGLVEKPTLFRSAGRNALVYPFYTSPEDGRLDLAAHIVAAYLTRPETVLVQSISKPGDPHTVLSVRQDQTGLIDTSNLNLKPLPAENGRIPYVSSNPAKPVVELLGCAPLAELPGPIPVQGYGDYTLAEDQDGQIVTVEYGVPVGYAQLYAGSNHDGTSPSLLTLDLKTKTVADLALQLHAADGTHLATIQLSGPATRAPNVVRARVPFDDQWQAVQAVIPALPRPVAEIRLTPYPSPGQIRKGLFVDNVIRIRNLTLAPAAADAQTADRAPANPLDVLAAEFRELPALLPTNRAAALRDALSAPDPDLRTAAVELLTRTKTDDPETLALLLAVARSANETAVPIAIQALAHQDTAESWAAIRSILEKGPFPYHQLAAWSVLADRPKDESWGQLAILLGIQSNPALRRAAIILHRDIQSEASAYAILTGFQDADPSVRTLVAQSLDPNQEFFARRLIFSGVNDASEAVRTTALLRLFDSNIARLRTEAHRGIRDESVAVRLALLQAVADRADAQDRPVLQLAVVDPDPTVQAAALVAYRPQPGIVEAAEIQSAFATTSPSVAEALLHLAQAKNIQIPAETINRFRAWNDPRILALIQD